MRLTASRSLLAAFEKEGSSNRSRSCSVNLLGQSGSCPHFSREPSALSTPSSPSYVLPTSISSIPLITEALPNRDSSSFPVQADARSGIAGGNPARCPVLAPLHQQTTSIPGVLSIQSSSSVPLFALHRRQRTGQLTNVETPISLHNRNRRLKPRGSDSSA